MTDRQLETSEESGVARLTGGGEAITDAKMNFALHARTNVILDFTEN